MNTKEQLRKLLGIKVSRVSGRVSRVGDLVSVITKNGTVHLPKPSMTVTLGDLVVIESNQIIHNVGAENSVKRHVV